ncbi:MAG TPA: hypothetical protein VFX60_01050 [Micromonospora sp.]|nr:hypothetical protein [Micromonospora sp.]
MRPLWLCRACGAPWPCAIARLALCEEYATHPTALAIYLCLHLHEAAADLHRLNPHDAPAPGALYDRFLAWVRPRP